MKYTLLPLLLMLLVSACKKEDAMTPEGAQLYFRFQFDEDQQRLNNLGQPATIPSGHAAQTPDFQRLSIHVLDLTPDQFTPYGGGYLVYKGAETDAGSATAIDFDQAIVAEENQIFFSAPISDIPPGTYEYARVSVAYQQYDVKFNLRDVPVAGDLNQQSGTVASFVGYNTYISSLQPREQTLTVNEDKLQGFWAFETDLSSPYQAYNDIYSGEAPAGATTVVNPIAANSPIPPGSCIVTGKFAEPLVITGEETDDIFIDLSFSVNQSFEWEDYDANGELDLYVQDPNQSDRIVDMGLRGLIPTWGDQ